MATKSAIDTGETEKKDLQGNAVSLLPLGQCNALPGEVGRASLRKFKNLKKRNKTDRRCVSQIDACQVSIGTSPTSTFRVRIERRKKNEKDKMGLGMCSSMQFHRFHLHGGRGRSDQFFGEGEGR